MKTDKTTYSKSQSRTTDKVSKNKQPKISLKMTIGYPQFQSKIFPNKLHKIRKIIQILISQNLKQFTLQKQLTSFKGSFYTKSFCWSFTKFQSDCPLFKILVSPPFFSVLSLLSQRVPSTLTQPLPALIRPLINWFKQISKGWFYQFNCRFLSKISL